MRPLASPFRRLLEAADELGVAAATALRLTLLDILLRPAGHWQVRVPVMVLAALGLISRRALLAPALWLALACLSGLRVALDWPLPDNHAYLLAYWCLAVYLAFLSPAGPAVLARAARFLVGLAFVFAVLWKTLLAPDYLDGRFFRVTLLTDSRFGDAAMLLGGLSEEDLQANREALQPLPEGAELLEPLLIAEPPAFRVLATVATWGLLALEAAVALAFLLPGVGRVKHLMLLGFCAIVYTFAPVAGFGWLLLALGLAQCPPGERRLRVAYVLVFLVVLVGSEISLASLLLKILRA